MSQYTTILCFGAAIATLTPELPVTWSQNSEVNLVGGQSSALERVILGYRTIVIIIAHDILNL
jgi:hypothetical protein